MNSPHEYISNKYEPKYYELSKEVGKPTAYNVDTLDLKNVEEQLDKIEKAITAIDVQKEHFSENHYEHLMVTLKGIEATLRAIRAKLG